MQKKHWSATSASADCEHPRLVVIFVAAEYQWTASLAAVAVAFSVFPLLLFDSVNPEIGLSMNQKLAAAEEIQML